MSEPNFQANKASAGSGKTFRLTSAYLRVLLGGAAPESILATTFTRKAAGEVLERVLRRLAQAAQSGEDAAKLGAEIGRDDLTVQDARHQLRILAKNLHRVQILTIDSFFARLLKTFRYESGLALGAAPIDDKSIDAQQMRTDAIEKLIGSIDSDAIERYLAYKEPGKAPSRVIETIEELVSQYYDLYRSAPKEAWNALKSSKSPSETDMSLALASLERVCERSGKQIQNTVRQSIELAREERWDEFFEKGLPAKIIIGESTYNRKPLDSDLIAAFETLIESGRSVLISDLTRRTQSVYSILSSFDTIYSETRKQRGVMLFSDAPIALEKIFSQNDNDEATKRLEYDIDHLLLDEFQDTSPQQWSVIRPFAKRIEANALRGSLFCVGDVKQAIYGWRGGSAQIFDEFLSTISGINCTNSDISYRSSQMILDTVNIVFKDLSNNQAFSSSGDQKTAAEWSVQFHEHTQAKSDVIPGYAELIETNPQTPQSTENESDSSDNSDEQSEESLGHIQICASKIAEVSMQKPDNSIGVLVRSNKTVAPLLLALGKLGVDASAESASMLCDDASVNVILSALTLADHPSDQAAAYHVFTSPLANIIGLDSDSIPSAIRISSRIRRRLLEDGYSAVIGDWAAKLAKKSDKRSALRLEQLIGIAEKYGKNCGLRPSKFVKIALNESMEDPSPNQVRVMTIHKSKGLEFDIVFLTDLNSNIVGKNQTQILADRPSATQPVRAIYCFATKTQKLLDDKISLCANRNASERLTEGLCLLYVAMTRARYALYMMSCKPRVTKNGAPYKSLSFADILRYGLCKSEWTAPSENIISRTLFSLGDIDWESSKPFLQLKTEEKAQIVIPLPEKVAPIRQSLTRLLPSEAEEGGFVDAGTLLTIDDDEGAQQGIAIHAMINTISWLGESEMNDSALIDVALKHAKGSGAERALWAQDRLNELKAMLARPAIARELTKPGGDIEIWREKRFSVVSSKNNLIEGAFDRVVIERKADKISGVVIFDFKTDSLTNSSISEKTRVYRPQIMLYKEALQAMLGLEPSVIRAKLLFLRSGDAVEI